MLSFFSRSNKKKEKKVGIKKDAYLQMLSKELDKEKSETQFNNSSVFIPMARTQSMQVKSNSNNKRIKAAL